MPKDGDHTKAVTCRHCRRTFASDHFLRKHYGRRHPEKDFDKEYPTQTDVLKLQDNTQQEMAEQQKKETAQFVQTLKKELIESLGGSLGQLEREIGQIKGEQGKLEGLGRSSEDEQRRLEAALIQSTELLRGYKEQWTQQLNSHST